MSESNNDARHKTLSAKIHTVLKFDGERLSVGAILTAIGSQGFGLLLIIISLPSALPAPGPGYSTPLGCLIVFLGLQMVAGRRMPWLPKRCRGWSFSAKTGQAILRRSERFFAFIERFVRPRLLWVLSPVVQRMLAIGTIIMGMLMILPIPLTNTLPAIVVFLIGVALCERDGLVGIAAGVIGIAALCLYAVITGLIVYFIFHLNGDPAEFIEWFKSLLKSSPPPAIISWPYS